MWHSLCPQRAHGLIKERVYKLISIVQLNNSNDRNTKGTNKWIVKNQF